MSFKFHTLVFYLINQLHPVAFSPLRHFPCRLHASLMKTHSQSLASFLPSRYTSNRMCMGVKQRSLYNVSPPFVLFSIVLFLWNNLSTSNSTGLQHLTFPVLTSTFLKQFPHHQLNPLLPSVFFFHPLHYPFIFGVHFPSFHHIPSQSDPPFPDRLNDHPTNSTSQTSSPPACPHPFS